jgi:hypothetical protein
MDLYTDFFKTGGSETIKGWVVDYFIADYSMFKKINSFTNCSIIGMIDDWSMNYKFYKNGQYKKRKSDYSTGKITYKNGSIYRFRNVFILKDDQGTGIDFFLL